MNPINTDESKNLSQEAYSMRLVFALSEIRQEVQRAKSMFPVNFHNQHEAYAVILEEVDELWAEIKRNQRDYNLDHQRKEAKQAAAMLVRLMVELL
jgi:ABC-type transporter MlaC component